MFIPYGTDAPIYHWPRATIGLVAACLTVYLVTRHDLNAAEPWMLAFGQGLRPTQWLTYSFLHADPVSLVANMLFLWMFGMIVEGKLGTIKFLVAFLTLAVALGALEQGVFFARGKGHDLGSTGMIFALLAMAMVWAPKNDVSCIWVSFRPRQVDVPIALLATLYIVAEAIIGGLMGMAGVALNRAVVHLVAVGLGFLLATAILKARLVDCEGWDFFAVLTGEHSRGPRKRKQKQKQKQKAEGEFMFPGDEAWDDDPFDENEDEDNLPALGAARTNVLDQMRAAVKQEHGPAALEFYRRRVEREPIPPIPEPDHLALIKLLVRERMTARLVPLLERYVRKNPDATDQLRLVLARVLIRDERRPLQGARILAMVPLDPLSATLKALHRELAAEAAQLRQEGVLELEGEGW